MSTVQPTDKTLVNRAGVDYSTPVGTLMATIQDTDLLLVNRAGVDYKCSGLDFKAAMVPPTTINKPSITSPANNATGLGETPTFTSSAFSGTGITHSSSDWQVTLATDTGFASPVVQSMTDTTNLVSWNGGPLQPNTDYIVRVRHNGGGSSSAWSHAVSFKTKDSFIATASVGSLYLFSDPVTQPTPISCPVKLVNIAGSYNRYLFGVGVDGKVYRNATGTATPTALVEQTAFGANNAQIWVSYDAETNWLALKNDGTLVGHAGALTVPGGAKAVGLSSLGGISRVVIIEASDGKLYAYGKAAHNVGTYVTRADWALEEVAINLPGGLKLKEACGIVGNYYAAHLLILADNGDLYVSSDNSQYLSVMADMGIPTTGTNASPVRFVQPKKFKSIASAGSAYEGWASVSALADDGTLYVAQGASGKAFAAGALAFSQLGTGYASTAVSTYDYGSWFALKANGELWGGTGTKTAVKCVLPPGTGAGWKSLGQIPGAQNTYVIKPAIIIP